MYFFVNATKSYLIDKDIESYKRNMYVGSKLSIMGEDSRNFLVYDRRTMFRILASNNQDLIHFIKKYPEPFEFINKFDLKTITPEKWKEWIYEYCKNKEELLEDEKAGYFIQTIIVGENSNLSIDKTENIAAIIGTTDNGKISPKAPNTSVIYDKVDKEQTTRATAINTEISLKGKEISAEELGFNTDKEKSQEVTKDNEKHLNEQFIEAKAIPKDERENYKVVLLKINATKGVYGLSGSIGPIYNKNPLTNEEEFGIVFGGRGLFGVDFNYEKFDMSDGKFLLNLDFDFESYENENQPIKKFQGFKAGFEYKISAFWIGVGGGIDIIRIKENFITMKVQRIQELNL